jgi:cytochrome c5
MLNLIKLISVVKKIIPLFVLLFVAISCSKKTTGSKSVEKPPMEMEPLPPSSASPATPAGPEKKVETTSTIVNANPVGEKPSVMKPLEMAKTPTKEEAAATEAKLKIVLMAEGKEAYSVKCTKCHETFEPIKFNAAKWEKIIDWMGPRAKLEAHEKEAILAYVKNNAKK